MVTDRTKDIEKTPAKQGSADSDSEPNKINLRTAVNRPLRRVCRCHQ